MKESPWWQRYVMVRNVRVALELPHLECEPWLHAPKHLPYAGVGMCVSTYSTMRAFQLSVHLVPWVVDCESGTFYRFHSTLAIGTRQVEVIWLL